MIVRSSGREVKMEKADWIVPIGSDKIYNFIIRKLNAVVVLHVLVLKVSGKKNLKSVLCVPLAWSYKRRFSD